MQYTYDCAGGRSRLVWTNSHLSVVTTYAYGDEAIGGFSNASFFQLDKNPHQQTADADFSTG